MADADDIKEQEEQKDTKTEKGDKKSLVTRLLPWIIVVVVIVISAGSGFGLGRLFACSRTPEAVEIESV
jgi:flagellar basal body-associated protein FliL